MTLNLTKDCLDRLAGECELDVNAMTAHGQNVFLERIAGKTACCRPSPTRWTPKPWSGRRA